MMQFVQVNRVEHDEDWSYIGKKQRQVSPTDPVKLGDQYVFIGIDASRRRSSPIASGSEMATIGR
jgi:hypothetical protein